MTVKEARINLRKVLAIFRKRIRFPRIRIREILEAEDIVSILKEFGQSQLQRKLEGR